MADTKAPQVVETQHERWVKYGANVALTIVIAVILTGFLIYIAQRRSIRTDTTAGVPAVSMILTPLSTTASA